VAAPGSGYLRDQDKARDPWSEAGFFWNPGMLPSLVTSVYVCVCVCVCVCVWEGAES
jgi:hypothetical protein